MKILPAVAQAALLATAIALPSAPALAVELVAEGPVLPDLRDHYPDQFASILEEARSTADALRADGLLPRLSSDSPLFIWPMRQASGFDDPGAWATISNVDHDARYPGYLLDYLGGGRTYDLDSGYNHAGTDTVAWPFGWAKTALGQVQMVAAAPGTIVLKHDGEFDGECEADFDEDREANYVVIQHSDGSMAVYGHLKNGSVIKKKLGKQVSAGEVLGLMGSSGYSGYPHLHFEVYDSRERLIDPFAGPYNSMNEDTWWQDQQPYFDSGLLQVLTHYQEPNGGQCRRHERTAVARHFQPGDPVFLASYHRYLLRGQRTHFAVYRPDGSFFETWSEKARERRQALAAYVFAIQLPDDAEAGTWRFEADDGTRVATTDFQVGGDDSEPVVLKVRPNRIRAGSSANIKIKGRFFPQGLVPDIQTPDRNERSIEIRRFAAKSKRVTLNVRVAGDARLGMKDIVLTAPDYSQIVIPDAFEVVP